MVMNINKDIINTNIFIKIIYLFCKPYRIFKIIDKKPNWITPFIIVTVLYILYHIFTFDIKLEDKINKMQIKNIPQERIETVQAKMGSFEKYYLIPLIPLGVILVWTMYALIFDLLGKKIIQKDIEFIKIYSIIAWSSIIGMGLDKIIVTLLALYKGTLHGVNTSLVKIFPTPSLGQELSLVYLIFSEINIFTIWQVFLLIIGFSIIYNTHSKKSAFLVFTFFIPFILFKLFIYLV
jgi:hypothetical protein